jgi:hypothetical protein
MSITLNIFGKNPDAWLLLYTNNVPNAIGEFDTTTVMLEKEPFEDEEQLYLYQTRIWVQQEQKYVVKTQFLTKVEYENL